MRTLPAACPLAVPAPDADDALGASLPTDATSAEDGASDEAPEDDELCVFAPVDGAVDATLVVDVDVVANAGTHVDAASALPRGGGSFGFPPPCGW
jgi:hypothetical protein